MEILGRIKHIGQTQVVGVNSNFQKRELVIITEEQYPQHIMIEFHQDKCPILDNYKVGQVVEVAINLRGREWVNPQGETKYFNSIVGWRIAPKGNAQTSHTPAQPQTQNFNSNEAEDDLPF